MVMIKKIEKVSVDLIFLGKAFHDEKKRTFAICCSTNCGSFKEVHVR